MADTIERARDAVRDPATARRRAGRAVARTEREYAGNEERPLRAYSGLIGVYGITGAALAGIALRRESRRRLRSLSAGDVVLLAVATFKLSRVVARDSVMSPLRAPFVRFEGSAPSPAEVEERVRGRGWRKAVGELLTCPFCLDQWFATGLVGAWLLAPDVTRAAATTLSVAVVADGLQLAYTSAAKAAG